MALAFSVMLDVCVFLLPLCWLVFSYGTILRKLRVDISTCGGSIAGKYGVLDGRKRHSMPTIIPMSTYKEPSTATKTSIRANRNVNDGDHHNEQEPLTIFVNGAKNGSLQNYVNNGNGDGNADPEISAKERQNLSSDVLQLQQSSTSTDIASSQKVFTGLF